MNTQLLQFQKLSLYYTKRLNIYKRRSKEVAFLDHTRKVTKESNNIIKLFRTMSVPSRKIQSTIIPQIEVFST